MNNCGGALLSNRSFDTDAPRRAFASRRSSPPVAGQLQRSTSRFCAVAIPV
jgi:hypothetical protein